MVEQTGKTPNPADGLPKFKSNVAAKYLAEDPQTREAEDGSGEKKREQYLAYLARVRQQRASFLTAKERVMLRDFTVERNGETGRLEVFQGSEVVAMLDENGVGAPLKHPAGSKENVVHNAEALIRSLAVYKAAFSHDTVVLGSIDPTERLMAAKVAELMGVRALNPPEESLDAVDFRLAAQIERVCDRMGMRAPRMRNLASSFAPMPGTTTRMPAATPANTGAQAQADAPRVAPG